MGANSDKFCISNIYFFEDCSHIACDIYAFASCPLARERMGSEEWVVLVLYKQSETLCELRLCVRRLFLKHFFEASTVGDADLAHVTIEEISSSHLLI